MSQMQRRQSLVRSDGRQSGTLFHVTIDGPIFVCGAVIVAECDQRPELKLQILESFGMIVLLQFVLHHGAVLTLNHEYGLLDLNALDFVSEDGKWIEAELLEVSKSLRVNYAGIAVCREIKGLSFDEQCFFQLGEHDDAADRRFVAATSNPW